MSWKGGRWEEGKRGGRREVYDMSKGAGREEAGRREEGRRGV